MNDIDRMCHPRGIAIFGNVTKVGGFAHLILAAHILYGFKGKIYPVSRKGGEIGGLKVINSLSEADGPVDLASISVPAPAVPDILRECLAHGVTGVTLHTSGFAEIGAEGKAIQDEIEEIARQGLRIVGPNCFGIYCPGGGLTFLPGADYPQESGNVGLIFQSGGMGNDFMHEAEATGIRISKAFSYGNGVDLDAIKLMDYLADDPETEVIGAYLEGVKDGRQFLKAVSKAAAKKPVVIWKGGLTPLGARMTMSHTASLGGASDIWKAAMQQAGVISVSDLDGLVDTLSILTYLKKPGKKIGIMGGGGAIGVYSSDLAYRLGLELPVFAKETQDKLMDILQTPGASVINPIDMAAPTLPVEMVIGLIRETLIREPLDVFVLISLLHPLELFTQMISRFSGVKLPPTEDYFEKL
jgi:acyl-CoA synthetase (NDP forming)